MALVCRLPAASLRGTVSGPGLQSRDGRLAHGNPVITPDAHPSKPLLSSQCRHHGNVQRRHQFLAAQPDWPASAAGERGTLTLGKAAIPHFSAAS